MEKLTSAEQAVIMLTAIALANFSFPSVGFLADVGAQLMACMSFVVLTVALVWIKNRDRFL